MRRRLYEWMVNRHWFTCWHPYRVVVDSLGYHTYRNTHKFEHRYKCPTCLRTGWWD